MSNFSKFLNGIYNYASANNRTVFVRDFFKVAGKEDGVFASDELIKSICNGQRVLSDTLMDEFPKKPNTEKEILFLKKTLNHLRIKEMLVEFEMDDDEKEDFDALCEAIATQFENFMKYGDSANTTVKSIYESILDSNLKGGENANVDAVIAATRLFYSSVEAMKSIELDGSLFKARTPIENYLRSIFDVFNAFNVRCNHTGRLAYKRVRDSYFKKNANISYYLKMVSEPGSLPLDLENTVTIKMWNCGKLDGDFIIDATFNYDMEYTPDALIYCFKTFVPDDSPEIDFSEYLNIHLKGDERSLISNFREITKEIYSLLLAMQKEFRAEAECETINKSVIEILRQINGVQLSLVSDGVYYPSEHRVQFASTMEMFMVEKDGNMKATGDDKFEFKTFKQYYSDSFLNFMIKFAAMLLTVVTLKIENNVKKSDVSQVMTDECKTEIMTELILLDKDENARYYMFPPTCPAKTYRRIKEISEKIHDDKTLAFVFGQIITAAKTVKSDEDELKDINEGERYFVIIGYWNKKTYQIAIPMKYVDASEVNLVNGEYKFCEEIWDYFGHPQLVPESACSLLYRIYEEIHKVEDEGYTIDYLKEI